MNQFMYNRAFPKATVTKTASILTDGDNCYGCYQIMSSGHIQLTWQEPASNNRFLTESELTEFLPLHKLLPHHNGNVLDKLSIISKK